jgi:hypothetical protein
VHGLVLPVRALETIKRPARQLSHLAELRFDLLQNLGRQRSAQVRAQDAVVGVLIGQLGRGLIERHGATSRTKKGGPLGEPPLPANEVALDPAHAHGLGQRFQQSHQ